MKLLRFALLTFLFFFCVGPSFAKNTYQTAYQSTGLLWATATPNHPDNMRAVDQGICSVWNLKKVGGGYIVATAAHCVQFEGLEKYVIFSVSYADPVLSSRVADGLFGPSTEYYFKKPTILYPAFVLALGDKNTAVDVALLYVKTSEKLPVLSLADSSKVRIGDHVFNASIPQDDPIAKGVFFGQVTRASITSDSPIIGGHIAASFIGPGGGSSGSSVISERQHGVIGVLVESAGNLFLMVPSNVLRDFLKREKNAIKYEAYR